MRKRKLQVFLSSTYEDLIDERLAAIEAVLAAGHIPAAMEQFSPGDATAWEVIRTWIDESDAFMLILGGRYGSIEPISGKSYAHLEYEYAVRTKKPYFAVVVSAAAHERRVTQTGLRFDEREHQREYRDFRTLVSGNLCAFWEDKKDIKARIFQKLPEWSNRTDLVGWVRGNEAASPEVTNEIARLSQENRELRARELMLGEDFAALSLEELCSLLQDHKYTSGEAAHVYQTLLQPNIKLSVEPGDLLHVFLQLYEGPARAVNAGDNEFARKAMEYLHSFGLVEYNPTGFYYLSEVGRRFKNKLLLRSRQPS